MGGGFLFCFFLWFKGYLLVGLRVWGFKGLRGLGLRVRRVLLKTLVLSYHIWDI